MRNVRSITTYLDYKDRPTELTEEELTWFYAVVQTAQMATGCDVPIIPYDHDLYRGRSKDALGSCCTCDPDHPLNADAETYITIDCYFIDECFKHEFRGAFLIGGEDLIDVVAHELAHCFVWRHGKKHSAKTTEFEQMIRAEWEHRKEHGA